jgi:SAM-dependent methyltransferase
LEPDNVVDDEAAAYARRNPGWHAGDAAFKAAALDAVWADLRVSSVADVGCGTGHVSAALRARLLARGAAPERWEAWDPVDLGPGPDPAVQRRTGDWWSAGDPVELALLVDVLEHLVDPLDALRKAPASRLLLRVPLELSVRDVLRPRHRIEARARYRHLHHWDLPALMLLLGEAGFIVERRRLDRVPVPAATAAHGVLDFLRRHGGETAAAWLGGSSVVLLTRRATR